MKNVFKKLFLIALFIAFLVNLLAFAISKDAYYGIWALLLMASVTINVKVEVSK